MAFVPIDYGPQVAPDDQGIQAMQRATAQHEQVFAEAHQLGAVIEGGARNITQGILHTQSLKATAAVKERQASTLQFIDSNPYVPKAVLQQRMTPEDYAGWHAGLATEYQKADVVPMFTAAGAMFDSEAAQARKAAGETISLPGWRAGWTASEQTESATIRERYVNRMAADHMIADQRAQGLMAIDKTVEAAVQPEDLDAAAKMAETSPWLKPAERKMTMEKVLVAKDGFVAKNAMLAGDTDVMKSELDKLRGSDAVTHYPNMNVPQRLALERQLTREYGFKATKDEAAKIVEVNVSETGKPDVAGIEKGLTEYAGENKADVVKEVRAETSQRQSLFHAQMAEVQRSVFTAGQDPRTGNFSYRKAMSDPNARKAAEQLNEDAPEMIASLKKEDQRNVNIEARATAVERREARAQLVEASQGHLDDIHKQLDDPDVAPEFRKMTPAQFDSSLFSRDMTEPDRQKARAAFAQFQKRGGVPDAVVQRAVNAEIYAAAQGNHLQVEKLKSKFGSRLLESASKFGRDNPDIPPNERAVELQKHVRGEMLRGDVVGTGLLFNDSATRIDWETNPKYAGKPFKLSDGTFISPEEQRVSITSPDGKTSGTVSPAVAEEWRKKGWK